MTPTSSTVSPLLVTPTSLSFNGSLYSVVLGRGGIVGNKTEGDGGTPEGIFPLRRVFYNPSRITRPITNLPLVTIAGDDGWSDDPQDPAYNTWVKLPHAYGHERLWREDSLYDIFIEVGYNDGPAIPHKGSAIFIHTAPPSGFTQGCVALSRQDLLQIIPSLLPDTHIKITR